MKKLFILGLLILLTGILIMQSQKDGKDPAIMGPGVYNVFFLFGDLLTVFSGITIYNKSKP